MLYGIDCKNPISDNWWIKQTDCICGRAFIVAVCKKNCSIAVSRYCLLSSGRSHAWCLTDIFYWLFASQITILSTEQPSRYRPPAGVIPTVFPTSPPTKVSRWNTSTEVYEHPVSEMIAYHEAVNHAFNAGMRYMPILHVARQHALPLRLMGAVA